MGLPKFSVRNTALPLAILLSMGILLQTACTLVIGSTPETGQFRMLTPRAVDRFAGIASWRVDGESDSQQFSAEALANGQILEVNKVPLGNWQITVSGLDTEGSAIWQANALVEILPGINSFSVRLERLVPIPASLVARWSFESGSFVADQGAYEAFPGMGGTPAPSSAPSSTFSTTLAVEGEHRLAFDSNPGLNPNQATWLDIKTAGGQDVDLGENFSISLWVKPGIPSNGKNKMVLVSNQTGSFDAGGKTNGSGFSLSVNNYQATPNGLLCLETSDGTNYRAAWSDASLLSQAWNHLVLNIDTRLGRGTVYLNGNLVIQADTTGGFSAGLACSGQLLRFGSYPEDYMAFIGEMDKLEIFYGTLSPAQIRAAGYFSAGDGSAGNPFQIADARDLDAVRWFNSVSQASCFVLAADIDLSAYPSWEPIGGQGGAFFGTLDGQSHTVSALQITGTANYAGLFGIVGDSGVPGVFPELRNLTIRGTDLSGGSYLGSLAGRTYQTTVVNCHAELSGTMDVGGSYAGGLVGSAQKSDFSVCSFKGTISSTGYEIGGLIGQIADNCPIFQCSTSGSLSGVNRLGGLVGNWNTISGVACSVSESGSDSDITLANTGGYEAGGLIGTVAFTATGANLSLTDCYATGSIIGNLSNTGGGMVGNANMVAGATFSIARCYSVVPIFGTSVAEMLLGVKSGGGSYPLPTDTVSANDLSMSQTVLAPSSTATTTAMKDGTLGSFPNFSAGPWVALAGHYPHLAWQEGLGIALP